MRCVSHIGSWAIKLSLALLLGAGTYLLTVNLVLLPHLPTALATEAQPHTDWSFYVTTADRATAYNLGCNQGRYDAGFSPPADSLVVLDFGIQTSDGTGVYTTQEDPKTDKPMLNTDIEGVSYNFAQGYYSCTGPGDSTSVLTLGVGVNDSDPSFSDATYTALGKDWDNVVGTIISGTSNFRTQVKIWGAADLEAWNYPTGYVTSDQGTAWVNGYSSIDIAPYVNYGDALGCPTSYTTGKGKLCSYGYYQYDYYYYSWGAPPSLVAPEIYTTSPDNSEQWTNISLYAKNIKGVTMQFEGPWDENDFHPSELTSSQAWSIFWNDLNAAGVYSFMNYSLEIHCEVSGKCPNS